MPPPGAKSTLGTPPAPPAPLGARLEARQQGQNGPPSSLSASGTMSDRMAAQPVVAKAPLKVHAAVDLSNLSKDPHVLKEQLRRMEEDIQELSTASSAGSGGDTKMDLETSAAEKGMTKDERKQQTSLRQELANTASELQRLSRDSIADDLRMRGVPPTMEAYETKYKEAKAQMIEAERDKSRALQALQALVGGSAALKDIVVAAKLKHSKNIQMNNNNQKRMSIDDYRPSYQGIDLSTANGASGKVSTGNTQQPPRQQQLRQPPLTPTPTVSTFLFLFGACK